MKGIDVARGLSARKPFPLVIQTYFYEPDLFLTDGHGRATEAAQTLAARGFAVLSLNSPFGVPDEGPRLLSASMPRWSN